MIEIKMSGKNGCIVIKFKEHNISFCKIDCYETFDINGFIEINSRSYFTKGKISFTLADIYIFYKDLKNLYNNLQGEAQFCSLFPGELKICIEFFENGSVIIGGSYKESYSYNNILKFNIDSDQSYFQETIQKLERLFNN